MNEVLTTTKNQWVTDPTHTEINFKVKHMMFTTVTGKFTDYDVQVETENDDFMTAKISFTAKTNSVSTGAEGRDTHLRSADFFDSETYPELKFSATKYEMVDNDGSYELYGDLTIKNITRQVKLDVEFGGVQKNPWGSEVAVFSINGKINRKDWELNWNALLEGGGVLVAEDVRINCEVQLVRK